jgi:quaternary ammonium compound-resistance protein SugE
MEIAATQNTLGWIVGGSLFFSIGAGFMKAAVGFTRPVPSAAVAVAFLIGSVMVSRAVMTESMSTAIIVGLGIEAVASVMIGMMLHGERVSPAHGFGMLLIVGGVGVLRLM